jgi:hypothetical protein
MKLNLVPARTGFKWVREGIQTFFRQPLALVGLFFMYMAFMLVASQIPLVGVLLAGILVPGATLGQMAATQEAARGKFPMPSILISAFKAGKQQLRAILMLGVMYTVLSLLASSIAALVTPANVPAGGSQANTAVLLALLLHLPLVLMFWHAPALVHWHGVPPVKSVFFSFVACMRNIGAFVVYAISWTVLIMLMGVVIALAATAIGSAEAARVVMLPFAFLMAAMISTSLYFTFRDSFVATDPTPDADPDTAATPS